jgi:hypothetical protein
MKGEKALFFDTGPVISLVMSRLVWILPHLKKQYGGHFYITPAVKLELVDRPISVKRFEFEALQVMKLISDGTLEVYEKVPKSNSSQLINLANNTFSINGKTIDVIQEGEIESVSCALNVGADAVVMDERTLRLFIENGSELKSLLERRFNSEVLADTDKIKAFGQALKGIIIIRSVELVAIAFKLGILNAYIPKEKNGSEILLDSVLWATRYNGCSVMDSEIESIKSFLLK